MIHDSSNQATSLELMHYLVNRYLIKMIDFVPMYSCSISAGWECKWPAGSSRPLQYLQLIVRTRNKSFRGNLLHAQLTVKSWLLFSNRYTERCKNQLHRQVRLKCNCSMQIFSILTIGHVQNLSAMIAEPALSCQGDCMYPRCPGAA